MSSKPPVASCSGLRAGDSLCSGTPSTTQSGLLLPDRLFVPLILILDWVPGCPELADMLTPASSPCIRALTDARGFELNFSESIMPTLPVMRLTVVWP